MVVAWVTVKIMMEELVSELVSGGLLSYSLMHVILDLFVLDLLCKCSAWLASSAWSWSCR